MSIKMDMLLITRSNPAAIFGCRDQRLICLDPGFPVHGIRIGIRVRRKGCRVDSHRLVFISQLQVPAEPPPVDRMRSGTIGAIFCQFEVPPPFLDIVQPAAPGYIIQLRQQGCRRRNIGCCPAKGRIGKQPFEIPGTGLHATPAHRTTFGGNPVGCTFLAV